MEKVKLIKFSDGTYGIRRGSYFSGYTYFDLKDSSDFWWDKSSDYFPDCQGSEEKAREIYNRYNVTDEVIT